MSHRPLTLSSLRRWSGPRVGRHYSTAVVLAALVACGGSPEQAPEPTVSARPDAAQLPLATIEVASDEDLARLVNTGSGKPRLVNFWATWCGPCLLEIPDLVAFAAAHPEVEVVLVNLDLPTLRSTHVETFLTEHDVRGVRVVMVDDRDPGGIAGRVVPGWNDIIPYTLLLRADGSRAATFRRAVTRAELDEKLAAL